MKKKFGVITALLLAITLAGCSKKEEVVVYTAVDQVFADKIFEEFEKETGITVLPVYDTEANKTTGLVNRIIAEKEEPVCDVFWNNEFIQTIDLEQKSMLQPYVSPSADTIPDYYKSADSNWTAMGGRARVLLVNNDSLVEADFPTGIMDFVSDKYERQQLAIAYPMFGTTRTMAAAIYAQLGEEEGKAYFQKIVDKGVQVVDGNSVTKDMAVTGQAAIGFTDSDDAKEAIADGANVTMVYPDQGPEDMGTLMTPNTVALVAGAPNGENAKKFIDFVLSEKIERELVEDGFFDISIRDAKTEGSIKGMSLQLEDIYKYLDVASKDMEELFSTVQ
ncbi:TPA: extracellular solute-binding protein [Streptococcus suis]